MQGSSRGFLWFLALPPFPPMSPVWTPQGLRKEGEAGVGGLQVCLESQTVLHFPYVSLQLSLLNERGSGQTDQSGRSKKQTHTNSPNVPNVFRLCTSTWVWGRGC